LTLHRTESVEKEVQESRKQVVGYARVSTADQNLDMQMIALKEYGVPEHQIFSDKMSGASQKRPGLRAAIRAAQGSDVEFVVWKLDRLGRTVRGIIDTMQGFQDCQLHLVSLTERFDMASPMGNAMFHIMAAMAQMERDLIRERTRAGLKAARERGDAHGRPQAVTPERAKQAELMVLAGAAAGQILPVLQAMDGPKIGRSRVYQWVREYRAELSLALEAETGNV